MTHIDGGRRRGSRAPRWGVLAACVLTTLAVLVASVGHSLALWQSADSGAGELTVGSISFQIRDASGANASPADPTSAQAPAYVFTPLTQSAGTLLPGSVRGAAAEFVNTGSVPLAISITGVRAPTTTAAQSDFARALRVSIRPPGATGCDDQIVDQDFRVLDDVTPSRPLVLTDVASPLAVHGSARICVVLAVAADVPATAQGQSLSLILDVRADQVRG